MTEVPSILNQTAWPCQFFMFGNAKVPQCDYFNCGLVTINNTDWLITRRAEWVPGLSMGKNSLMAFRLAADHTPEVGYRIHALGSLQEHQEDPRAIFHQGQLWISYCNFIVLGPRNSRWTGAHQVLTRVQENWHCVQRFDPVYGDNGSTLWNGTGQEKNWLWFFHENRLHMVYKANPQTVVQFNNGLGADRQWATTAPYLPWEHGEIRGGTPPVLHDGEYWTFFHSSVPITVGSRKTRQYFMGAYAFQAEPPFAMTRITPKPLLIGSMADHLQPHQKKPLVVFPCGSLLRNGQWFVTLGVNDVNCAWLEVPHAELAALTVSAGKRPLLTTLRSLVTKA